MSEEDIKINGIVQVAKFFIFGLFYMIVLYVAVTATHTQILDNSMVSTITDGAARYLSQHSHNEAVAIFVAGIIFLATIGGILISDVTRKFSIVSLVLFLIISVVDLVPIKLISQGSNIL